jgi:long-chain acyl-CoA synthetase
MGRLSDAIGNPAVFPQEIEAALLAHPLVREAAVTVVRHPVHGPLLKAFVALWEEESATSKELRAFCAEQLSPEKVPTEVEERRRLPRSVLGLLSREQLVEEDRERLPSAGLGEVVGEPCPVPSGSSLD